MPTGRCACGEYTYEVPDSLQATVVCHCVPCRKFAGSNGSTNAIVPRDQYKVLTGETRSWKRKGDSGKEVENFYCANCSNLMRVEIEAMADVMVFKPGTLDDKTLLDKLPVVQEIYTKDKPDCYEALKNAEQKEVA